MKLESVYQLQALNEIMCGQFYRYPVSSAMVLGVAGGNGLEHIDPARTKRVYGVDVNAAYLDACAERFTELSGVFVPILADLCGASLSLPRADILIADLVVEYIGYAALQNAVGQANPGYVSAVIQLNPDSGFVSDSPYLHAFDALDAVHRQIDAQGLEQAMAQTGYTQIYSEQTPLPNGKSLLRLDFQLK
jgi:hypothetical protein